ncbi:hypothetical protein BC826DRAFT_149071 [Russula brevipes]|nr:hypothetical protein BC826DRAFT_149071 [Russula brevipes]
MSRDWGTSTGPRGPPYRTQPHGHPHHQNYPPTRMHAGPSAGQPNATWVTGNLPAEGGRTPNQYQYSDHLFQGMQGPHQAYVRLDTSQARTSLGTGVGVSRHQTPFDSGPHCSTTLPITSWPARLVEENCTLSPSVTVYVDPSLYSIYS